VSIHEECGVFGMFSTFQQDIASIVKVGLFALQHRGQESCGIVVNADRQFYTHKDLGLVGDVFTNEVMEKFPQGTLGIGHVRYATTGATNRNNCQPIEVNHQKGLLALAHNGNISNAFELRNELELNGAIFHSTSDTETIAYIVTRERLKSKSIEEAISKAMNYLDGAYSLLFMSATKMIAVRDPYGFRPLCYGVMEDGTYIVASESCALDAVGAKFVRDVEPNEIIVFSRDGIQSYKENCKKKEKATCVFEYIYFARPDSIIDGVDVHTSRVKAGQILAQCAPVEADVVIGVPDSGLDGAIGYAYESKIPYKLGIIKNKYIARTFIAPNQSERINGVQIKLNPIKSVIEGKRVVLIDDSIVRGTTCRRIVDLLRKNGAKEVHMRISAPPFKYPCFYGTDIDSSENLIANQLTIEQIREKIGADSLAYLPIEELKTIVSHEGICTSCFTGQYPTQVPVDTRKSRFENK